MPVQNIQVGDIVPIELQMADGAIDQYPRAIVYDQDSLLLITIDLSHDNEGNYSGTSYNFPDKSFIKVVYIVYSDAPHTTENTKYERALDVFYRILPDEFKANVSLLSLEATAQTILNDTNDLQINQGNWITAIGFATSNEYDARMTTLQDSLNRVLGLSQENQAIDQTIHVGDNLTSARLRIYSDAVSVGTDLNVTDTYTITATYTATGMETYKMVKV